MRAHEDEDNSLQYHFHRYKENKHFMDINGYLAYNKLKILNTKIMKLSGKLKDTYGITVGTDHLQCSEISDTIIKYEDCNIRPIQNGTSVYQMKLCTVRSSLIISRRTF